MAVSQVRELHGGRKMTKTEVKQLERIRDKLCERRTKHDAESADLTKRINWLTQVIADRGADEGETA